MGKKFNNLKLSKKMTLASVSLAIIALLIGIFGLFSIFTMKAAGDNLYKEYTLGLQHSGTAAVNYEKLRYEMLKLSYSWDQEQPVIDALIKSMNDSIAAINDSLAQLNSTLKTQEYKTILADIEVNWKKYTDIIDINLKYVSTHDFNSLKLNAAAAGELGTIIRADFSKLGSGLSEATKAKAASNDQLSVIAAIVIGIMIVVGLVVAMLMGKLFTKSIAAPLKKLAFAAEKLSVGNANLEGDLDQKDYELKFRQDEIGVLALAFNKLIAYMRELAQVTQQIASGDLTVRVDVKAEEDMLGQSLKHLVSSISELVSSIQTASQQVESGSNLLSGSSVSLSQGTTEQASAIEQLTASLEAISDQTNVNAKSADEASVLSTKARKNADNGNRLMSEMQNAMDEINESSKKISKIIKVIDDIAFQTNILALNAAVEAARAGQHGKGFAVVAEEVRTLAARSANAAKETTDMIETSIQKVDSGTQLAADTAKALASIVKQVEDAANLVNSIAIASKEQAMGIDQISQGIAQVSQVTATNVATSEETAAASEELASQSSLLRETVSVFKISTGLKGYTASDALPKAHAAPVRSLPSENADAPKHISLDDDFGKY